MERWCVVVGVAALGVLSAAWVEAQEGEVVRLAFTGDVALTRHGMTFMLGHPGPLAWEDNPLRPVAPWFKEADLTVVNLEGVLTRDHRVVRSISPKYFLWSPVGWANIFAPAHVDVVSVANNHGFDAGAAGLLETIGAVEATGVHVIGGGATTARARAPYIHPVGEGCVAVVPGTLLSNQPVVPGDADLAYYPQRRPDALFEAIRGAAARCDVVVAYVHWGLGATRQPGAWLRTVAHEMRRAGADVIVGHHPHVLQGVEFIDGGVVAYSLGNLVFANPDPAWRQGGVLMVEVRVGERAKIEAVSLRPTWVSSPEVEARPNSPERTRKLLPWMRGWCAPLGTRVELEGGRLRFHPDRAPPRARPYPKPGR